MSDSSLPDDPASEGEPTARTHATVPARVSAGAVTNPIRVVSFWTAAVLPFMYLPLFAYGLDSPLRATIFVALVAANVVALVVGRTHSAE